MISKEKLQELKDELRRGAKSRIAEQTGYSRSYVSDVLSGRHYNYEVIEAAIRVRNEQRAEQKELEDKL